jgi:hypothetical protein
VPTTPTISTTDARVFAALMALFGVLFAAMVRWLPGALLGAAVFTAASTLLAVAFNRDAGVWRQARGLLFSGLLACGWLMSADATIPGLLSVTIVFMVAGTLTLFSATLATRFRANWMDAVAPIGWSVSAVLLAAVYFLVLTPIGLVRRLVSRDPLRLRFEETDSYWIERTPPADRRREYRQY